MLDPKYTRVFSMVTSCFSRAVPKLEKVNFGDSLPCSSLYSLRGLKRLVTLATRYQNQTSCDSIFLFQFYLYVEHSNVKQILETMKMTVAAGTSSHREAEKKRKQSINPTRN